MSERVATKLTEIAIETGAISETDRKLYQYAYMILVEYIISWGSIFIIAALMHQWYGALLFALFFIPLRIFAGGFHARSFLGCYLLSVISFLFFCMIAPFVTSIPQSTVYMFIIICSVVIFALAPIADPNKPFEGNDEFRNKNKARMVLVIELTVAYGLYFFSILTEIYCFIAFSFFLISLSLIVAAIKSKNPQKS